MTFFPAYGFTLFNSLKFQKPSNTRKPGNILIGRKFSFSFPQDQNMLKDSKKKKKNNTIKKKQKKNCLQFFLHFLVPDHRVFRHIHLMLYNIHCNKLIKFLSQFTYSLTSNCVFIIIIIGNIFNLVLSVYMQEVPNLHTQYGINDYINQKIVFIFIWMQTNMVKNINF